MKRSAWILVVAVGIGLTGGAATAVADSILGSAGNFAVLAGSTVTSTGATSVKGDLGVSPGTAITGFPPGTVVGTINANNPIAAQGETDLTIAFNYLSGLPSNTNLSGTNLGGLTLTQGVYKFDAAAQLTGTLMLSGPGLFIFQIGSSLTADNNSAIVVSGGADPSNLYFQVGSSATVGTGAGLLGDIVALQSISMGTGSTLTGAALAINGAVTLQGNTITVAGAAVPEPGTAALFTIAMGSMIALAFRRQHRKQQGMRCDNASRRAIPNATT